jgi:hypothetical protein
MTMPRLWNTTCTLLLLLLCGQKDQGSGGGVRLVRARPDGAPNCELNGAAPMSQHLTSSPVKSRVTGSIADYGYDLVINGRIMDPNGVGQVLVNTTQAVQFRLRPSVTIPPEAWRGVLLIVHQAGVDRSTELTPVTPAYTVAGGCTGQPVSGVTHPDNGLKNTSAPVALLRMTQLNSTNLRLNVNLVIANNATNSIYYYSQFALEAVTALAPTRAPTRAPIRPPTKSPNKAPTKAPIQPPTKAPTKPPTKVPTRAPTKPNKLCGLFSLRIFCPIRRCGVLGTALGLCK